MEVRLNHIITFNLGDEESPDWQPITYYTENGNRYGETIPNTYTRPQISYPLYEKNGNSVLLSDGNGEIDTSSQLYKNFYFLIDEDQSTIEIEAVLLHSSLNSILDGALVKLSDVNENESRYKVLSIEGFIFDQQFSVVKLKIKKYVDEANISI